MNEKKSDALELRYSRDDRRIVCPGAPGSPNEIRKTQRVRMRVGRGAESAITNEEPPCPRCPTLLLSRSCRPSKSERWGTLIKLRKVPRK